MGVEWWAIVASGVAVLASGVVSVFMYKLSKRQTEASERQADSAAQAVRESLEPHVVVYFEIIRRTVNVVVQNIGQSVARNVRVAFDPPLTSADPHEDHLIADAKMFAQGIPTLPPGHRLVAFLDSALDRFNSTQPTEYTATVTCIGPFGPVAAETYNLDLALFGDVLRVNVLDIHDVALALNDLNKTAKKWKIDGS